MILLMFCSIWFANILLRIFTFMLISDIWLVIFFFCSFYYKGVLNLVTYFLCVYRDDHMVFILLFANMVYHIDRFEYTEESLHPCDKPHLIMMYDPFNVLLDSVCKYFVEDFCIYINQWYWRVIFFFLGIRMVVPS